VPAISSCLVQRSIHEFVWCSKSFLSGALETEMSEWLEEHAWKAKRASDINPVRCENPVMRLGDTRERRRRDDRGAECADRRKSMPAKLVGAAPVAPATALYVAGACCNDRRTHGGSAQGAPGSESATDRSILSGQSARTARQPRWLAARETVSERPQCRHFGICHQTGP
jgi:hypothetical protein